MANLRLVTIVRTAVLLAIGVWLLVRYDLAVMWQNLVILAVLIALGIAQLRIRQRRPDALWPPMVFASLDVIIFTVALLAPGNAYPDDWPWQMALRPPTFLYMFLPLALAVLTLQPLVTLWTGLMIALSWSVGTALIVAHPDTVTDLLLPGTAPSAGGWLEGYLRATYVHLDDAAVRIFVTLVVTAILALATLRARRLLFEQVEAARQRANLARYLDPTVVDQLAGRDQPLGQVRTQQLVVLFADMQGFTRTAESLPPERVIELLRGFHGRLAEAVFAHGGSIDKFMGDAQMAIFGLPEATADDAIRALRCAEAICTSLNHWNVERAKAGEPPVHVGIGLHLGEAVLGEIGGGERFEFAVIGDAVNVAARLERLTRELDTPVVVSGTIAKAVAGLDLLEHYERLPAQALRGRDGTLDVYVRTTPLDAPAPTP
ncbi:MAG: adenylate/guanylate cyclase domain-containing protein [Geminicoccaceae bacterium]|nr:MAG: adenylate/guanylate cyclase domain-containing protein [Geminicoccaceae bacterium]